MFEIISVFLVENTVLIGSGTAIFGAGVTAIEVIFAPFRTWRSKRRGPEKVQIVNQDTFAPIQTPAPPVEVIVNQATQAGGLLTISLDDYEAGLAKKLADKEQELTTAHDEEKALLTQQIQELTRRAQNPEAALAEAQATIRKLEETLEREGNEIGETRMAEARKALEAGDFSIADDIFAEIEAREQLAVERAARAAFARGEIAEQEIRWADAAAHFAKAARLNPTYKTLFSARKHAWRCGYINPALSFGTQLLDAAENEFGKTKEKYAAALNEHALTLKQAGQFEAAEPLYKQAMKIGKETIGENHPDYATRLNNLANLYESMGRYDDAEPLFKQAIEIDKKTIGEKHPSYATRLNNLANLYESMGRYDDAEPLFKQAIEILESTLGPDHPNTIQGKANLAHLQSRR